MWRVEDLDNFTLCYYIVLLWCGVQAGMERTRFDEAVGYLAAHPEIQAWILAEAAHRDKA